MRFPGIKEINNTEADHIINYEQAKYKKHTNFYMTWTKFDTR